jgi:hypothetical protein
MEKVTTHAGLDVQKERIVIATLKGQAVKSRVVCKSDSR